MGKLFIIRRYQSRSTATGEMINRFEDVAEINLTGSGLTLDQVYLSAPRVGNTSFRRLLPSHAGRLGLEPNTEFRFGT